MKSTDENKMLFYDRFADQFDNRMNRYDLERRLQIVFEELLPEEITERNFLDAGSGTGWFSLAAVKRGACVTSLDVGDKILAQVAKKCDSERIVGSVLKMPFDDETFDIVLSTEVIEHTPDPHAAILEMHRVIKRGGVLALTVPNRFWHWSVVLANQLGLRPYEGYENWVHWHQLRQWLHDAGFTIELMRGIHLFPFTLKFSQPLLAYGDRFGTSLGPVMVNICVRAVKL